MRVLPTYLSLWQDCNPAKWHGKKRLRGQKLLGQLTDYLDFWPSLTRLFTGRKAPRSQQSGELP
ncbi:MAG: hypothetical protein JWL59_309 [Chthoniobacteraceae bacterium]|nr:hypothetical protein [Chthoniobacteraceae bacterium]